MLCFLFPLFLLSLPPFSASVSRAVRRCECANGCGYSVFLFSCLGSILTFIFLFIFLGFNGRLFRYRRNGLRSDHFPFLAVVYDWPTCRDQDVLFRIVDVMRQNAYVFNEWALKLFSRWAPLCSEPRSLSVDQACRRSLRQYCLSSPLDVISGLDAVTRFWLAAWWSGYMDRWWLRIAYSHGPVMRVLVIIRVSDLLLVPGWVLTILIIGIPRCPVGTLASSSILLGFIFPAARSMVSFVNGGFLPGSCFLYFVLIFQFLRGFDPSLVHFLSGAYVCSSGRSS